MTRIQRLNNCWPKFRFIAIHDVRFLYRLDKDALIASIVVSKKRHVACPNSLVIHLPEPVKQIQQARYFERAFLFIPPLTAPVSCIRRHVAGMSEQKLTASQRQLARLGPTIILSDA